ncbi:MAG: hypothetical protein DRJ47_04310 [Thermoprotei archaeon]|nr:MAG: hypothetical protein DRJ47_04310 [Thermoprotei archaeon]
MKSSKMIKAVIKGISNYVKIYLYINLFISLYSIGKGYINPIRDYWKMINFSMLLLKISAPVLLICLVLEMINALKSRRKQVIYRKVIF